MHGEQACWQETAVLMCWDGLASVQLTGKVSGLQVSMMAEIPADAALLMSESCEIEHPADMLLLAQQQRCCFGIKPALALLALCCPAGAHVLHCCNPAPPAMLCCAEVCAGVLMFAAHLYVPAFRSLRLVLPPSITGQVLAMPLPLT
jgi:hypothetical protein